MKRKYDSLGTSNGGDHLDEEAFMARERAIFEYNISEILRLKPHESVSAKYVNKGPELLLYCPHDTADKCRAANKSGNVCELSHWKEVTFQNTNPSTGDCIPNYYCKKRKECTNVHYELENPHVLAKAIEQRKAKNLSDCQWLGLNVNNDALNVLGSGYNVIMINTPNDESNSSIEILTKVADLANEGLLFMWAETTKKLEFCREQIPKWGYKIIDDIVWVKTTPLQRIYRSTTPTQGHFTSSKEHCLVAYKGSGDIRTMPLNRQIDCDVIVSEMRPHGQKPDEIYSMIERLYPTSRKLELFGSKKTPGWITCSPNIDGFQITDREMQKRYETLKSKNKSS